MNKKLLYIAVILMIAVLFIGASVHSFAQTPEIIEEDELVVYYDTTIKEVVGVEPMSPSLWMLPEGEHMVITHDGVPMTVLAENGSWQYIQ